jgi:hypothetical protein
MNDDTPKKLTRLFAYVPCNMRGVHYPKTFRVYRTAAIATERERIDFLTNMTLITLEVERINMR